MVLLLKNYTCTLPRIQRGSIIFQGGVQFFLGGGGVQMLISIETHIHTCYFPGGVRTPYPPLDMHMGLCHHNGTIFIIVPLQTIIVRH